jgi:hypothetical protein
VQESTVSLGEAIGLVAQNDKMARKVAGFAVVVVILGICCLYLFWSPYERDLLESISMQDDSLVMVVAHSEAHQRFTYGMSQDLGVRIKTVWHFKITYRVIDGKVDLIPDIQLLFRDSERKDSFLQFRQLPGGGIIVIDKRHNGEIKVMSCSSNSNSLKQIILPPQAAQVGKWSRWPVFTAMSAFFAVHNPQIYIFNAHTLEKLPANFISELIRTNGVDLTSDTESLAITDDLSRAIVAKSNNNNLELSVFTTNASPQKASLPIGADNRLLQAAVVDGELWWLAKDWDTIVGNLGGKLLRTKLDYFRSWDPGHASILFESVGFNCDSRKTFTQPLRIWHYRTGDVTELRLDYDIFHDRLRRARARKFAQP